jgi:hypothetical protein
LGPEVAADARAFLVHLQDAVAKDDRNAVSKMANYPLRVLLDGHPALLKTPASLLQNYSAVFTPTVKHAIRDQSVACLGYASSGYTPEQGGTASS